MAAKPCPNCDGCGKIASHNSKPWTQFKGLAYNSEKMTVVRESETSPITCETCAGTGVEAEKPTITKK